MKLTIITGPQGSGKTLRLIETCKNINTVSYDSTRLNSYPIHLPQFTENIECIVFEAVNDLAHILRLAALMSEEMLKYKVTTPGITYERINVDIVIATSLDKKVIFHIFRGIPNVHFRELKPL